MVERIQKKQLDLLLEEASDTETGRTYDFPNIAGPDVFRRRVPVSGYEDIKPEIEQIKRGKKDVFWPGSIRQFSVSAGTTSEGKHLPLTDSRLRSDRHFLHRVAFNYIRERPHIWKLLGSHLSLPGSIEEQTVNNRRIQVGEISGFLGSMTPFMLRPFQLIRPDKLREYSFSEKFNRILEASLSADVRVITAVPSWTLTIFQEALRKTGLSTIGELWPNLQLLICGGVKLKHYRPYLQRLCGDIQPDFLETYGASEGYFAFSDRLSQEEDMRLVVNNGIYYEWVPVPSQNNTGINEEAEAVPTWKVKTGQAYQMLVTTNAGLWRYRVGDVIEFTSLHPPRIRVKGRVREVLDEYGEAVYGWEAVQALEDTLNEYNLEYTTFTVGARLKDEMQRPRHHWFIAFTGSRPFQSKALKNMLSRQLDSILRSMNRHYDIRRESGALSAPRIHPINTTDIREWLQKQGKLGAQGKLPRILSDKKQTEALFKIQNRRI